MNKAKLNNDEAGSSGAPMIRLNFREFKLAPQFEHLKDAPVGEFDTCNTLWPIGLDRKPRTWTLSEVIALLEKHRQRATYAAVASIVGGTPGTLMSSSPKIPRNSWVVSKKNGQPTDYEPSQLHRHLKKRPKIISEAEELADWLENPR